MLKQIWSWGVLFPLLHPVWFNLFLLLISWSICGVAYQSNDDLVIASVIDGWGDPSYADNHVIFVNPLLTGFLLKIAPVLGGLSVWPVFLILATWFSCAIIFTILTVHVRKVKRYDFSAIVLLLMWTLIVPRFFVALQFSYAAFLLSFAGVLLCLKHGTSSWKGLFIGVSLCILGGMVRLEASLECDFFWAAVLFAGCLDGFNINREKLFARSRLLLALGSVLIISLGLNEYNKYAHRQVLEECDIVEWNRARSLLSDTSPIRSESEYQCEKYGVSSNDIKMVQNFTNCDMDAFNKIYLDKLLLARDGDSLGLKAWVRMKKALHLFSWNSIKDLSVCWILFALFCFVVFKRGCSLVLLYCVGSVLVMCLLYMSSIDRLYFHVVYPTFLIAGGCLFWTDRYQSVHLRIKGKGRWGVIASMLCACFISFTRAWASVWEANQEYFYPDTGRSLCDRVAQEPDALFCVQLSGDTIDDFAPGQTIFHKAWSCSHKNVVTLGGWNYPLKPVQQKLKEMGWKGQSVLNLCRDKVYIVCLIPDGDVSGMDSKFTGMLSLHILERYGVRTVCYLDENILGVRIYRLHRVLS